MNSLSTHNVTSLPASGAGASHSNSPTGQSIAKSGPAHVLANLSARQVKELGLLTSGTCGPHSSTSLSSADLQQSLASKLQAATASTGSTLYALIWKVRPTPLGRPICALRASVRRTSASGSTGWPTPTAALADKGVRTFEGGLLEAMRNHGPDLAAAACLAGWPTPRASENVQTNIDQIAETGSSWLGQNRGATVSTMARMCDKVGQPIRYTASGQVLTGSDAGMESSGQLSPDHSRWLMGYPPAWQHCVVTAMRLCRPLRRPSLKR